MDNKATNESATLSNTSYSIYNIRFFFDSIVYQIKKAWYLQV